MPAKSSSKTPNTWFNWESEEHGTLEVSAYVPKGAKDAKKVKVVGVGVPDDIHVSPREAGLKGSDVLALKVLALKNRGTSKAAVAAPATPDDDDELPW
jgi:hypothetical protein